MVSNSRRMIPCHNQKQCFPHPFPIASFGTAYCRIDSFTSSIALSPCPKRGQGGRVASRQESEKEIMNIGEYIILKADNSVEMQTTVNEHIKKGYAIHGLLIVINAGAGLCFFQAMVK
jgi:hypothetical protein